MRLKRAMICAFCIFAAACLPTAIAWETPGHTRIHDFAASLLTPRQRQQVKRLLRGDLEEFGGWEHAMTVKYPQTKALHWHRQSREFTCDVAFRSEAWINNMFPGSVKKSNLSNPFHMVHKIMKQTPPPDSNLGLGICDEKGVEGGSLLCALFYFFEHFAHKLLLKQYSQPAVPINTPTELVAVSSLPKSERTSASFLRWLVILIGDLYQPLHFLGEERDFGSSLKVVWEGKQHSLLDFWEDHLPRRAIFKSDLGQHAPSHVVSNKFQERAMSWGYMSPTDLFRNWARDSVMVGCTQIFRPIHASLGNVTTEPFVLTQETYNTWTRLAEDRIILAAQSLAFVLQDLLEHIRHKESHHQGRGRRHRKTKWLRNLGKNAGLCAVVVPGVLLLLNWHAGPSSSSCFARSAKSAKA